MLKRCVFHKLKDCVDDSKQCCYDRAQKITVLLQRGKQWLLARSMFVMVSSNLSFTQTQMDAGFLYSLFSWVPIIRYGNCMLKKRSTIVE